MNNCVVMGERLSSIDDVGLQGLVMVKLLKDPHLPKHGKMEKVVWYVGQWSIRVFRGNNFLWAM